MRTLLSLARLIGIILLLWPVCGSAIEGDRATHQSDHDEDVILLPPVHVHGLPLNKDQQLGPVPTYTPWPKIPPSLDGQELDDWMKARFLIAKDAQFTVVVLEPAKHRELTIAGISALNQWKFDPQMRGDEPVDGELTVRIHFRTQ
ncbi:MAG: energy transducer TonB [Nitrospirae bacterium]|nr:energy transducer TonB [Nitrospirota bacterium]